MPQLTPEELQEAKRRRAEERRQEEERLRIQQEQEAESLRIQEEREAEDMRQAQKQYRERREREGQLFERYQALANYVVGIYDEVSKLSAKRSTDPVSERMVGRANRAIRSAKELLAGEDYPFLNEIEEFIPAGEDVEARDVVLTLRQVKDALDWMRARHIDDWRHL
jgi:hypothetical protein